MEQNITFDEKKQLNDLLKSFKELFKFVNLFEGNKLKNTDAIEQLDRAIKGIPASDLFARALDENISKAKSFIEQAKSIRVQSFKKHEAEYIKSLRTEGIKIKEYSDGWRTGKFMLKVKPELSKIKILYNEQNLIDWTSVNSKDDFINLEAKANEKLSFIVIPEQEIIDIFFEAFIQAKNHLSGNTSLVHIRDFYKEVRIALIRKLLEKNSMVKIDKYLEFPLWAFLYNLDIYRSPGSKVPPGKKLGLQTGSQQESSKGLVVNGLDPHEDYKVMCYITAPQGGFNI